MADHRPGFTPGEVGERAGRADARPRLTCSLATVSQEFAMRFSDAVKRQGRVRPPEPGSARFPRPPLGIQ
jgi:hypothetical protein